MTECKDTLGDRCKLHESQATYSKAVPGKPLIARLDGRSFHTLTAGMDRPFDKRFQYVMQTTTEYLVNETHPMLAYTQSDEITLMWHIEPDATGKQSSFMFDGKFQKLTSVLAGMTSAKFATEFAINFQWEGSRWANFTPHFDCRVWQVPTLNDAADVFAWREQDARKNAITMAAQSYYSHSELHGKSSSDKLAMLAAKGVRFNDYPRHFTAGLYLRRVHVERDLTTEELSRIPEQHRPVNGRAVRTEIQYLRFPPLRLTANRADVLFHNAHPIMDNA